MNLKHMSLKVDLQWAHGTEDSKTGWKENQTDERDDTERKKREREKEEWIRLWSLNKHWLICIKKKLLLLEEHYKVYTESKMKL